MKKRGQITLFIILGIVLLIAIALVIIFREEITIFRPERIIPTETTVIQRFIDGCIEITATEGLNLLGAQGGYIYLPPSIENNPLAVVDTGIKIPQWDYFGQSRIPSIPLMEGHLSRYMIENLKDCLQNLEPFQAQYDIIERGELEAETEIVEEAVIFKVTFPIEIVNKEGTRITELKEFRIDSPIKLKKVYEVAKSIMETESEEMRVEKITVDLIALDPDIPISGIELGCGQKIWIKTDVENKLKTLLRNNLPRIRVDRTNYLPIPEDQPYLQNHYVWRVTELAYPEVRASINLAESPFSPFKMFVRPSDALCSKAVY